MEKNVHKTSAPPCILSGVPYVSVWDGGQEVESTCTIDGRTGIILEIDAAAIRAARLAGLNILDREYVVLNDEDITVFQAENGDKAIALYGTHNHTTVTGKANELMDERIQKALDVPVLLCALSDTFVSEFMFDGTASEDKVKKFFNLYLSCDESQKTALEKAVTSLTGWDITGLMDLAEQRRCVSFDVGRNTFPAIRDADGAVHCSSCNSEIVCDECGDMPPYPKYT